MKRFLEQTAEPELTKSDELLAGGAPLSAAVRLAALWASSSELTETDRASMEHAIRSRFDLMDLDNLKEELVQKTERLRRILSGRHLGFEDIVLALTFRIEIALVDGCVSQFPKIGSFNIHLQDCDELLLELSKVPKTRSAFLSARASIEKNWRRRVPFDVGLIGMVELLGA
jgi:hypothetical protein